MSEWISVEKRLPELEDKVLVFAKCTIDGFTDDTIIAITSMTDKNPLFPSYKCDAYWINPWQYFSKDYKITHWMPLPEAPSERKIAVCPFCGGEAHLEDMGWPHHVYCVECGAKVTSTKFGEEGEAEAIEKWNKRYIYQGSM